MAGLTFLFATTFFPPYHLGGDAVHVKSLADELVKNGHQVHVIYSMDAFMLKKLGQKGELEKNGVYTYPIKTVFNSSAYSAYFFGQSTIITRKFKELLNNIRPDVVHSHNVSLLGYNLFKRQGDYKNIYTSHDYWLVCSQNNLFRNGTKECTGHSCITCALRRKKLPQLWRYSGGFNKALSSLDLVIAPSNSLQKRLERELGVKSVVINNFVPRPPNNISQVNYSEYFLFVGALERHKGILNLLKIFKKLQGKITAKLIIAGDGSLKNYLKFFIRKYSLSDSVLLLGPVDEDALYALYKGANALVVPSVWPETSSLVLMEALSVGTPAIVSNIGALPEITRKIDNSLIFNNSEQLENILINITKNSFDRTKLIRLYEEYFSPKVYIDCYLETIKSKCW